MNGIDRNGRSSWLKRLGAVASLAGLGALLWAVIPLTAADEPGLDEPPAAADAAAPASTLYREDPLQSSTEYRRRLALLTDAERGDRQKLDPLLYNLVLAWREEKQISRAQDVITALASRHPRELELQLLALETAGAAGADETQLQALGRQAVAAAGADPAGRMRVIRSILTRHGLRSLRRDALDAALVETRELLKANQADGALAWVRSLDSWLAQAGDVHRRRLLWSQLLADNRPWDRETYRAIHRGLFATQKPDAARAEAQKFWEQELVADRAGWPADYSISAAMDRVHCLEEILDTYDDARAEFERGKMEFGQLALVCSGVEKANALNGLWQWSKGLCDQEFAPDSLRADVQAMRRRVAEQALADAALPGSALVAVGAVLDEYVEWVSHQPQVDARTVAEIAIAAVLAYDRAVKAGESEQCEGLNAVLRAIRITGDHPDLPGNRGKTFQFVFDYARLLKDEKTALPAAHLFRDWLAETIGDAPADERVMQMALQQKAGPATLADLIRTDRHTPETADALLLLIDAALKAHPQSPELLLVASEKFLAMNLWDRAAEQLHTLAGLEPKAEFDADVATASALSKADALESSLPVECEAVLRTAFRIAPADSAIRGAVAQKLSGLCHRQGNVAGAQTVLATWWEQSKTARALQAAALAQVQLTLTQEHDLVGAQGIYAAVVERLPNDPFGRMRVVQALLTALADQGALKPFLALIETELAQPGLHPAVRAQLLQLRADEQQVQGDWAAALTDYQAALAVLAAAEAHPLTALQPGVFAEVPTRTGLWNRMRQLAERFPAAQAGFEAAALKAVEPAAQEPEVGLQLAGHFAATRQLQKRADLIGRLAGERPWNDGLRLQAAAAYEQAGDKAAAIAAYLQALKENPIDLDSVFSLHRLARETGDRALQGQMQIRLLDRITAADIARQHGALLAQQQTDLLLELDRAVLDGGRTLDAGVVDRLFHERIAQGDAAGAAHVVGVFCEQRAGEVLAQTAAADLAGIVPAGDLYQIIRGWELTAEQRTGLLNELPNVLPVLAWGDGEVTLAMQINRLAQKEMTWLQAGLLRADGRIDAAVALLLPATRLEFLRLQNQYDRIEEFQIALCQRALAQQPAIDYPAEVHRALVVAYERAGQGEKIFDSYRWLVEHAKPADRTAWQIRYAQLLLAKNRWQDALASYDAALAAEPTAKVIVAAWWIRKGHPVDGQPDAGAWLDQQVKACAGPPYLALRRDLRDRLRDSSEWDRAEALARGVLEDTPVRDRMQAVVALRELLVRQKKFVQAVAVMDAAATTGMAVADLRPQLQQYLVDLNETGQFTAAALAASPFLKALPQAEVWAAEVLLALQRAPLWKEFTVTNWDRTQPFNRDYFTALLNSQEYDRALAGLLEIDNPTAAPAQWGVFKQSPARQWLVAELLKTTLPEFAVPVYAALGRNPASLDGVRARLAEAECRLVIGQIKEAGAIYAGLSLTDPAAPEAAPPAAVAPASLQETWRLARFAYALNTVKNSDQAAQLLPVRRQAGSWSLRLAHLNELRSAGRFAETMERLEAALAVEMPHELPDDQRREWIFDLLAQSSNPDVVGEALRTKAYHLAFEGLRRAEFAARRAALNSAVAGNEPVQAQERACFQWLVLLRNMVRADSELRDELTAGLWALATSQPQPDTRMTRALVVIQGDVGGDAARLTVLEKMSQVQPLPVELLAVRLNLLRRLKRQDDVIAWYRDEVARHPESLESVFALAQELRIAADQPTAAEPDAAAWHAETDRLLEQLLAKLDPRDAAQLSGWAGRLADRHPELSLRLYRRAAMATSDLDAVHTLARVLAAQGQIEEAFEAELQGLFVREWRVREGRAAADDIPWHFADRFAELLRGDSDAAFALQALNAAHATAVSPRHTALLELTALRLECGLGHKPEALVIADRCAALDPAVRPALQRAIIAQFISRDWHAEVARYQVALAQTLPATAAVERNSLLDEAVSHYERADDVAAGIDVLKQRLALAAADEDISSRTLLLAKLHHQLGQTAEAEHAFETAMGTGSLTNRYDAWTQWRTLMLDLAQPADQDRVLKEFPTWVDRMETPGDQRRVLTDYIALLDSLQRWADAAEQADRLAKLSSGYAQTEALQRQISLLIRSRRAVEAAALVGAWVRQPNGSIYSVANLFRPVLSNMDAATAADWLVTHLPASDLTWSQWQQFVGNAVSDYQIRQTVLEFVAERLLPDRLDSDELVTWTISQLCQQGEYDRAFRWIDRALAATPAVNGDRRIGMANLLAGLGCPGKAEALIRIAAAPAPVGSFAANRLALQSAENELRLGHGEAAVTHWVTVRRDSAFATQRTQARARLFNYYMQSQRDAQAAEQLYREVQAVNPGGSESNWMFEELRRFYLDRAEVAAADALLQARLNAGMVSAIETDLLTLDRAQLQIDDALAARKEPTGAVVAAVFDVFRRGYLRLARNLDDNATDANYQRARLMLTLIWVRGKSGAAWKRVEPELARLAAQERPGYHRISDLRLDVFRRREDRESVVAELTARTQRDPDDAGLHNQLIQACVEAKQYNAAAELLRQDQRARPEDYRPAFALVDLLLAAGQAEQAQTAWQAALPLAPQNPAELSRLGARYEERRRYEWALELYRRQQAIQPDLHAADNLARLAERMEQPLEAVQTYLAYYQGLFAQHRDGVQVDYSLAGRMTPYARFERDFEPAVQRVLAARAKAPTTAEKAFLTLALAELQAMRRRQSEAEALYREAASYVFPGRFALLQHLLNRLPERKTPEVALDLARKTVQDPEFTERFTRPQQVTLLQRYAQLALAGGQTAERDTAWKTLIDTALPIEQPRLCSQYAELLYQSKQYTAAAEYFERAIAHTNETGVCRQAYSRLIDCWEQIQDRTRAAAISDRFCAFEAQMANGGDLVAQLGRGLRCWLDAGLPLDAAKLLERYSAADVLTDAQRSEVFNRGGGILQAFNLNEDLNPVLSALGKYLPAAEHWQVPQLAAQWIARSDLDAARELLAQAQAEVKSADLPPGRKLAANIELLQTSVGILSSARRAGAAAALWKEGIEAYGTRLPNGDGRLIQLYLAADRSDLAVQACLEALKTGDRDRVRQLADEIRNVGYNVQNSRDVRVRNRYQPIAVAVLTAGDANLIGEVAQIWMNILVRQDRYADLLVYCNQALAALPADSDFRRQVAETGYGHLSNLWNDSRREKLPRPDPAALLDLFAEASWPALESNRRQPPSNSIGWILEKMNLQEAAAKRIREQASRRIAATDRPIAISAHAGNLVRQLLGNQHQESVLWWEAALAAGSPQHVELLGSLRDGYRQLNQLDVALQKQAELLKLNPWDFTNRTEYAALLTELHHDAEADAAWLAAGKLAETSEDQLYNLAERMRSVNRFDGAIETYKAAYALAKRRGAVNSWRRAQIVGGLTRAEWALGNRPQAFKFWNEGLAWISRRDGQHGVLMNALVDLLAGVPDADLDRIIVDYETERGPSRLENPNLRDAFGQAWERKSHSVGEDAARRKLEQKALQQLAIAADLLPQEPRIRERMIGIYSRRNEYVAMIAQYRELSRNDPKNIDHYEQMGELYAKLKQPAEREKAWSMILEALPRDGAGHRRLAEIYRREKMLPRAVLEARAVVDNRPEDPASYTLLAEMLRLNAEFPEAEKVFLGVLARGEEWLAKRYWPGEWQDPSQTGLLNLYFEWTRARLDAGDAGAAAEVRRRAHAQPFVLASLRAQRLPTNDREDTPQEWNAKVRAWQFLRDQLPSEAAPPAPPPPPDVEPIDPVDPVDPPVIDADEEVEVLDLAEPVIDAVE